MFRFALVAGLIMLASPALAGNHHRVHVQNFALQSGLVVTPFAVPVASPVAVAQVNPYIYGFSPGGSAAQGYSAASVKDAELDKIADKVVEKLRAAGFGGMKPLAIPEKPSLVRETCAKCHSGASAAKGFRVDVTLTPEAKLKSIGRMLADDQARRMPKGKALDPQTLGLILQELAGKSDPVPPPPVAK